MRQKLRENFEHFRKCCKNQGVLKLVFALSSRNVKSCRVDISKCSIACFLRFWSNKNQANVEKKSQDLPDNFPEHAELFYRTILTQMHWNETLTVAQKKALAVTSNWKLYKIGRHSCILSLFHEIVHELECRLVVCGGVLSHHISTFTKKLAKSKQLYTLGAYL